MRFNLVFKSMHRRQQTVEGQKNLNANDLTFQEWQDAMKIEGLLEKLTGVRLHIIQVDDDKENPNG